MGPTHPPNQPLTSRCSDCTLLQGCMGPPAAHVWWQRRRRRLGQQASGAAPGALWVWQPHSIQHARHRVPAFRAAGQRGVRAWRHQLEQPQHATSSMLAAAAVPAGGSAPTEGSADYMPRSQLNSKGQYCKGIEGGGAQRSTARRSVAQRRPGDSVCMCVCKGVLCMLCKAKGLRATSEANGSRQGVPGAAESGAQQNARGRLQVTGTQKEWAPAGGGAGRQCSVGGRGCGK